MITSPVSPDRAVTTVDHHGEVPLLRLRRRRQLLVAVVAAAVMVLAACSADDSAEQPQQINPAETTVVDDGDKSADLPYAGYASTVYGDAEAWLCRPDRTDVCDDDLTIETLGATGERSIEPFSAADDPGVDCFYVYPTVSNDPTPNSDLIPDGGEITAVQAQAARLAGSCRVFAPMYRQATLGTIAARIAGTADNTDRGEADKGGERDAGSGDNEPAPGPEPKSPADVAYESMLDAFRHYMANDNEGRGIVLVGHSQGTGLLARLIEEEFPVQPQLGDQLVSAVLAGLSVPEDAFEGVPVCTSPSDTTCFVAWASYRATEPPGPTGLFGRNGAQSRSACTNPADLVGGGPVALTAVFETNQAPVGQSWVADGAGEPPQAPWVALPGLVTGECVERDGFHYLEVTVVPDGFRTAVIPGDLTPDWGLHLVDMNLVMGDLTGLVSTQAAAWRKGR